MTGINTPKWSEKVNNSISAADITESTTEPVSKDLEEILVTDTRKFLNKFFAPVIENLWVPGYYFDDRMIKGLFSEEWLTMIDFKKTLYHKSRFFGHECMELDEKSYWENEKHNYKARINETTKQIEIYIDWWDNGKPNYSFSYDKNPDEESFNILKKLNTLHSQNREYQYACQQIWSSRRLLLYFDDEEHNKRDSNNIDKNFGTLKDLDHTIRIEDEKYKDFMLQLTEFTYLKKWSVSQLYTYISKDYLEGSIEKIKEMDDLALKKIHLFDNFPWYDNMTYSRWVFEELDGVRPYILLKYLQLKAKKSWDYILEFYADYIGSIEPKDMDPNDERIKEINISWGGTVARFMAESEW